MRAMIMVEVAKCVGCRGCQLACAVAHSKSQTLLGAVAEGSKPRVSVLSSGDLAIPLQCRQCEDAPCVAICPTGALTKPQENGLVATDDTKCIGCRACMLVCPFGVISVGGKGRAIVKCDLCVSRLDAGETPACVGSCKTGAMQYGDLEEMVAERRQRTAEETRQAESARSRLQSAQ
ncbi:MAG: 4Fe-4S dicluster domain-containing protein [Armatimonadota bacterium]